MSTEFHVNTPLVCVESLSGLSHAGEQVSVYFKLDNMQPSGSFKIRGIGHMIQSIAARGNLNGLVSTSGGNAGLAVATVSKHLKIPVTVFVPTTTKPLIIQKLEALGATVRVGGDNWNAADAIGRSFVNEAQGIFYIPPFDDPLLWDGHASLIEEIHTESVKPDVVILSVGGGGLLCGVQRGLERVGWTDTQIIAVETEGAASFAEAKRAGHPVSIPAITTIATSLGARAVTEACLASPITTHSLIVTDADALKACFWFLNEYRSLVEPACGASIAAALDMKRVKELVPHAKCILTIICGGSNISFDMMNEWKRTIIDPLQGNIASRDPIVRVAVTDEDIESCWPALYSLRPHLSKESFVDRVRDQMRDGYTLAFISGGSDSTLPAQAVAGFRLLNNLYMGRHIYVDDLVSLENRRGLGTVLMNWIKRKGEELGCAKIRLDSGVQRHGAHRFYLKNQFDIVAYSFASDAKPIVSSPK